MYIGFRVYIGTALLYRDKGEENGNCYIWGFMGTM